MADHSNTSLENGVLAKHVRVVDSDMPTKLIMASAKIGLWALKKNINPKDISRLIVDVFSKTTNDSSWGCIVGKNVALGAEYYGMYFMHFVIDDYTFFNSFLPLKCEMRFLSNIENVGCFVDIFWENGQMQHSLVV
ncbi:Dyneinlight chain,flagellar outer arm [Trichinella pseudospiralis]